MASRVNASMKRQQQRRLMQWLGVAVVVGGLAAMILLNVSHPQPVNKEAVAMSERLLAGDLANATPEEREQMRNQWERLSPDTQQMVFEEVAKGRLQEMRQEVAAVSEPERLARIEKAVQEMRQHRATMSEHERNETKNRLESPEGKQMIKRILDFYHSELTARERAEYDPLIHEWLLQVGEITSR